MNQDRALMKLDAAQQALAECKTVMDAKQISAAADAARIYLQRTNASVETVNRAIEVRTLAERKMGEFLAFTPKARGTRTVGGNSSSGGSVKEPPDDGPPTLADIGLKKKESMNTQKLAAIPAPEFHARIAVLKAGGEAPTATKVLAMETGFSPRAVAAGEEAARDSEKLWRLKTAWKRCGKRDRAEFAAWLKIQPQA